jgi:hypothetical protein
MLQNRFFYLMTVEKNIKFSWKEAFWNFCRVNKNTSRSRREEKAKKSESFLTESNANSVLNIILTLLAKLTKKQFSIYSLKMVECREPKSAKRSFAPEYFDF